MRANIYGLISLGFAVVMALIDAPEVHFVAWVVISQVWFAAHYVARALEGAGR